MSGKVQRFNTPLIPGEVYESLPAFLSKTSLLIEDDRRRDVNFLGLITMISGVIPTVCGIHDRNRLRSNLFLFIAAGAASGKGELNTAARVGEKFDQFMDDANAGEEESKSSKKPAFILSANTSMVALVEQLKVNNGLGFMYSTEADASSNSSRTEWGDISFISRGIFQHERVSISRKDREIKIHNPSLSIAFAGTPDQLPRIIQNTEDGLFSRYIFYLFDREPVWRSQAPKEKKEIAEFDALADEFLAFALFWRDQTLDFKMTGEQWQQHTEFSAK